MTGRTKIIGGIAIAAIVGGVFWFLNTGRTEITYNRVSEEDATKALAVLSKDQDNDGLKDWEEELWNTDALNPDTDGDGTSDGEEIPLGRNPNVAGPDDALDKETIETKTVPGGGEWTETDKLSREFFAKYLAIKQSGVPFTAEEEEKLLNEFAGRYTEPKPTKLYTESDIVFAQTDDEAAVRAYANAIGAVLNAHKENGEDELTIFERALQNDDEIDLANLEHRVRRYESMSSDFKKVLTPKNLAGMHIALLNSLEALKESVAGMAMAFTDPVRTLSLAAMYPTALDALTVAFDDIAGFLALKQITFREDEPGRILME